MKKVFLVILSVALIITGCENVDFGDTNENVNGPTEASTASLLSGAMTNFATRRGRPYRITPTLNVQYFMQLVYNDEMLYANTPGYWQSYYVQVGSNLQTVIDLCSAEGAESDITITKNGNVYNQLAVAKIFKAVVFKRVTDLFGDVPYTSAFNVTSLTPEYDAQEAIYRDMIDEVKEARDMIVETAAGPTGDAIYGGDMTAWIKFANSFLLQLSLQVSEAGSTEIDAAAEFADAVGHAGGLIETMADEAWYVFDVDNGFLNPWEWMRPADYGVTEQVISSLRGTGDNKVTSNTTADARLGFIVGTDTLDGLPYGYLDYGSGTPAPVNTVLLAAGTSLPLMTAGYTYLNRAEGAARGWSSEVVDDMITAGIEASFARFNSMYSASGHDAGDGVAYAAARVADAGTVAGGALQVIGEEKWVALYPLGYDAWSEWRRTGYPDLQPAPDAINDGNIPTRYNYPSEESTLNETNYSAGVSGLSPAEDKNTATVWWDK